MRESRLIPALLPSILSHRFVSWGNSAPCPWKTADEGVTVLSHSVCSHRFGEPGRFPAPKLKGSYCRPSMSSRGATPPLARGRPPTRVSRFCPALYPSIFSHQFGGLGRFPAPKLTGVCVNLRIVGQTERRGRHRDQLPLHVPVTRALNPKP